MNIIIEKVCYISIGRLRTDICDALTSCIETSSDGQNLFGPIRSVQTISDHTTMRGDDDSYIVLLTSYTAQ